MPGDVQRLMATSPLQSILLHTPGDTETFTEAKWRQCMPHFASLFLDGLMLCYDIKKTKKDKLPFLSVIRLGDWSRWLGLHGARELELLRCIGFCLFFREETGALYFQSILVRILAQRFWRDPEHMLRIDSHLHTFLDYYLTSLGLGRGSRPECVTGMCFPEPCGELSHTVNETVARAGQEPAGARASPGLGPAMPGRFQRVQLRQVTCLRQGASQARRLCD